MPKVAILKTETQPRPYQDHSIDDLFDDLFDDLILDSAHAQDLLDFSCGIYEDAGAKIEVRSVMAFLQSINERLKNVNDGLPSLIYELKQREKDWQTVRQREGR